MEKPQIFFDSKLLGYTSHTILHYILGHFCTSISEKGQNKQNKITFFVPKAKFVMAATPTIMGSQSK